MSDYEIKLMTVDNVSEYGEVIRVSFATIAKDLGLTRKNCPTHTSFITNERLIEKYKNGYYPFGLVVNGKIVGFVSLTDMNDGAYELNNLAVLPEYRHFGYGKIIIEFLKSKVIEMNGNKIILSMIDNNKQLKSWYETLGFKALYTKKFKQHPFTTCFMEMIL